MEYKWTVNKVTVAENNLITKVNLTVTATENNTTASAEYIRNLVRGDTFIPYEQLTEQQVLDWCFEPIFVDVWKDENNIEQSTFRLIKNEGENQASKLVEHQLARKAAEPALPWA
jgi:hypothetical protein